MADDTSGGMMPTQAAIVQYEHGSYLYQQDPKYGMVATRLLLPEDHEQIKEMKLEQIDPMQ